MTTTTICITRRRITSAYQPVIIWIVEIVIDKACRETLAASTGTETLVLENDLHCAGPTINVSQRLDDQRILWIGEIPHVDRLSRVGPRWERTRAYEVLGCASVDRSITRRPSRVCDLRYLRNNVGRGRFALYEKRRATGNDDKSDEQSSYEQKTMGKPPMIRGDQPQTHAVSKAVCSVVMHGQSKTRHAL